MKPRLVQQDSAGDRVRRRGLPGPREDSNSSRSQCGQTDIGGDSIEPGPNRRPAFESGVGPPGPQVGLLHQVLGIVGRADHPIAVRQQFPAEPLGLRREPVLVRRRPQMRRHAPSLNRRRTAGRYTFAADCLPAMRALLLQGRSHGSEPFAITTAPPHKRNRIPGQGAFGNSARGCGIARPPQLWR